MDDGRELGWMHFYGQRVSGRLLLLSCIVRCDTRSIVRVVSVVSVGEACELSCLAIYCCDSSPRTIEVR